MGGRTGDERALDSVPEERNPPEELLILDLGKKVLQEAAARSLPAEIVEGLRRACRIPVVSWDERFSTAHAERALIEGDVSRKNRKEVVDKVAAALILQNYLDALKISEGRPPEP